MVQIIDQNKPSFSRSLLGGLSQTLPDAISGLIERKRTARDLAAENEELGLPKGVTNQKIREKLIEQQGVQKKSAADLLKNEQEKEIVGKYLGKNFAEVYSALTEGGKTQAAKIAFEGLASNKPFEEILMEKVLTNPEEVNEIVNDINNGSSENFTNEKIEPTQQLDRTLSSEMNPEIPRKQRQVKLPAKEEVALEKGKIQEQEKYLKEVREKYQRAQSFKPVFSELRNVIRSGGANAFSMGNVADIGTKIGGPVGTVINSLGKAFESGDTGKFRALSKRLLDEMKDIFGGQIRVKELEVFLSMLPEIGKSQEANLASIDVLEKLSEASSMFYETSQDIIQKNSGKIPSNLSDQVQQKLKSVMKDISNDIEKTTSIFSKSHGKSLSREEAVKILKEAKGDKKLAEEIAKQRGYKL